MSKSEAETSSVRVAVRIRPFSEAELAGRRGPPPVVLHRTPGDPLLRVHSEAKPFTYDETFGEEASQEDLYTHLVEPLVGQFFEGYNATILAYGQTSSGKTHTMGTGEPDAAAAPEDIGIVPRAVEAVFGRIAQAKAAGSMDKFTVRVSYLEVYNEDLRDLLVDPEARVPVSIREDPRGRILWSGVQEMLVRSPEDVMRQLSEGSWRRQTGATDMNAHSSRSHAIFSIALRQERGGLGAGLRGAPARRGRGGTPSGIRPPSRNGLRAGAPRSVSSMSRRSDDTTPEDSPSPSSAGAEGTSLSAKFHFVDLAGSERLKRTNATGDRAKEGISINAGLSALGNVISALGDPSKRSTHVPYRDSKLTRLLQDSLGGNSATCMVACVSPAMANLAETLNTLKYANRARNIRNKVSRNEEMSSDVSWLQAQVTRLREELRVSRNSSPPPPSEAGTDDSSSSSIPLPTSPTMRGRSPNGRSHSLNPSRGNVGGGGGAGPSLRSPSSSRPVSPSPADPSPPPALLRRMRRMEEELARVNSSYRHLLGKYDATCTQLKDFKASQAQAQTPAPGQDVEFDEEEMRRVQERTLLPPTSPGASFQKDMEPVIEEYEKIVGSLEAKHSRLADSLARAEGDNRRLKDELKFAEHVQASNAGVISGLRSRILELELQVEVAVSRIDIALGGDVSAAAAAAAVAAAATASVPSPSPTATSVSLDRDLTSSGTYVAPVYPPSSSPMKEAPPLWI